MGEQIIKQPDGKLAVWSTIVDALTVTDATPEELVEWRVKRAAERERERTRAELERVLNEADPGPYYHRTMTWEEALERDRETTSED